MKKRLNNSKSVLLLLLIMFICKPGIAQDSRSLDEVDLESPRIFAGPNRVAVLVANKYYKTPFPQLTNPYEDALHLDDSLRALGFRVYIFKGLDLKAFRNLLDSLPEIYKNASVSLFYFGGHGIMLAGRNYLVPIGGKLNPDSLIYIGEITKIMDRTNIGIAILDACRNEPKSVSSGEELERLVKNSTLLLSTNDGHRASDNPNGKTSLFVDELLRHIGLPNIPFQQVAARTILGVTLRSGHDQIPVFVSKHKVEPVLRSNPGSSAADELIRKGDLHLAVQEFDQAKDRYQQAFRAGSAAGGYKMAELYESGYPKDDGTGKTGQNYEKALEWYEKSAKAGDDRAQARLGKWLLQSPIDFKKFREPVVRIDTALALNWLNKSAEKNNPYAKVLLGLMYLEGKGVPMVEEKSFQYFGDAARQGYVSGQALVGFCYEYGYGTGESANVEKAIVWYEMAARQGDAFAKKHLENLINSKIKK